jgi:protein TonB
MIGLSAALHGLVLVTAGSYLHTPDPTLENQFVSTLKITKVETFPQKKAAAKPPEKETVEKSVEPPAEPIPVEKTDYSEEVQENKEVQETGTDTGNNEESQEADEDAWNNGELPEKDTGGSEAITDHEYEALLAYIRDFINKNLVYPPTARRRNIQGVVGVYFEINKNGEIVSILSNRSSGNSILDNAAVSLVKKINPIENIQIKRKIVLNINIAYELTE